MKVVRNPVAADRPDVLLRSVGQALVIRGQVDTRHGGVSSFIKYALSSLVCLTAGSSLLDVTYPLGSVGQQWNSRWL